MVKHDEIDGDAPSEELEREDAPVRARTRAPVAGATLDLNIFVSAAMSPRGVPY